MASALQSKLQNEGFSSRRAPAEAPAEKPDAPNSCGKQRRWHASFNESWSEIAALGFDAEYVRHLSQLAMRLLISFAMFCQK